MRLELPSAGGQTVGAYQAATAETRGGLVLLQEIFGVNAHIRSLADRFAALGYGVVAPALFDRLAPGVELAYDAEGIERGKALRARVSDAEAMADTAAAVAQAARFGPVAVVGYCWGGRLAWLAAARPLGAKAVVAYYPGGIGDLVSEQPAIPTLLHFGAHDSSIPLSEVEALRARHPDIPVHLYPAGHGFSCDARPSFDPESHALALERTRIFLETHLR